VITESGPRLTALRSSMREGEAQVVLPRLVDDLLPWIQAMIARRLHDQPAPTWTPTPSVGLGLMARGYPHHFPVGESLSGIDTMEEGVLAFHSATENPSGLRYTPQLNRGSGFNMFGLMGGSQRTTLHTTGGLVLTVVGMGATLASARGRAIINAERVAFGGRTFRGDIGAKEFG
jgi:phosphoribosylamine--glycine ligase